MPLTWVKEICYTSRVFGPEEALRVGFVSEVCKNKGEAVGRAYAVAREIAAKSPVAVQGTKALVDWSRDRSVADGEFVFLTLLSMGDTGGKQEVIVEDALCASRG